MSAMSLARMVENRAHYAKKANEGCEHSKNQVASYDDLIAAHKVDSRERICMALIANGTFPHDVVDNAKTIVAYITGESEKPQDAVPVAEPKKYSLATLNAALLDLVESATGFHSQGVSYIKDGVCTKHNPYGYAQFVITMSDQKIKVATESE